MVRTRGSRGRGASSQAPPVPPPPSPELALILRSLEAINETLKGQQPAGTEVEPPPSGTGNPEVSRDSGGGPPPEDITRDCRRSNFRSLPEVAPVNARKHGWKA
jgi:hypothetical protein